MSYVWAMIAGVCMGFLLVTYRPQLRFWARMGELVAWGILWAVTVAAIRLG